MAVLSRSLIKLLLCRATAGYCCRLLQGFTRVHSWLPSHNVTKTREVPKIPKMPLSNSFLTERNGKGFWGFDDLVLLCCEKIRKVRFYSEWMSCKMTQPGVCRSGASVWQVWRSQRRCVCQVGGEAEGASSKVKVTNAIVINPPSLQHYFHSDVKFLLYDHLLVENINQPVWYFEPFCFVAGFA